MTVSKMRGIKKSPVTTQVHNRIKSHIQKNMDQAIADHRTVASTIRSQERMNTATRMSGMTNSFNAHKKSAFPPNTRNG